MGGQSPDSSKARSRAIHCYAIIAREDKVVLVGVSPLSTSEAAWFLRMGESSTRRRRARLMGFLDQ
jgi:hypothetical protein